MVAMETAICGRIALSPNHVIHHKSGTLSPYLSTCISLLYVCVYEFQELFFLMNCLYLIS